MSGYIPGILANGTVSPTTTAATVRTNIAAVGGATGSTDNRVLRADGTDGATAQNSAVTIDDSGNVSGVGTFTASGLVTATGGVTFGSGGGRATSTGTISVQNTNAIETWASFAGTRTGYWFDGGGGLPVFAMGSGGMIALASTSGAGLHDVSASRASAGVWQLGNGARNAIGSLNLTNLTASGTIATGVAVGTNNTGFACHTSLGVNISSTMAFAATSSTNPQGTRDVFQSRHSAGNWRFGTTATGTDAGIFCGAITASGSVSVGPITKSALLALTPTATAGEYRLTDVSQRRVYPDGTNWRYLSDDSIVS